MKRYLLILLLQFSLLTILIGQQQTYTWTGGGSSQSPTNNLNWDPPGPIPNFSTKKITNYLIIPSGLSIYPKFSTSGWTVGDPTIGAGSISIGNGGAVEFSGAVNILTNGTITVNPKASITIGGNLNIASGGTLTIKSDNTGDGMIKYDGTSPSTNVTVELYLTGGSNGSLPIFHYFVPPMQSIDIGTTLTSVMTALGLTNFHYDLLRYNEPNAISTQLQGWQYFDNYPGIAPGFTSLEPLNGYNIHLTANDKITFIGQMNTQDQTFDLNFTTGNAGAGWNLIGNPFPCNYDLSGVEGLGSIIDGIGNSVYYNKDGGYKYFNVFLNTGSTNYTSFIPPMQGFFVLTSKSGMTLSMTSLSKTIEQADPRSKGISDSKAPTVQKVKLLLNSGTKTDETVVLLFDDATNSYNEHYDAYKLFGTNTTSPFIYSKLNGVNYFMKAIPGPTLTSVTIPIEIVLRESGVQNITITEFQNLEGKNVVLKHGVVETTLSKNSTYSFTSEAGTFTDFSLVFSNVTTGIENTPNDKFKTWYNNNFLYINCPNEIIANSVNLIIYDTQGKVVYDNSKLYLSQKQTIQIPITLPKGVYITHISINNIPFASKFVVF